MKYYSYVLRSQKNGILYKGSTVNLGKRIIYHNQGKVRFTSKYTPWELVLSEEFATRSEALNREKWYKTGVGRDWIKSNLITRHFPLLPLLICFSQIDLGYLGYSFYYLNEVCSTSCQSLRQSRVFIE